jgi:hypothetical protein
VSTHTYLAIILLTGCNQLTAQSGVWLGQALAQNHTLRRLSLYNNRLRYDGLVGLGRGLAINRALQWLNLAANDLKDRAVRDFSRIIAPNTTILHVRSDDTLMRRLLRTSQTAVADVTDVAGRRRGKQAWRRE